MSFCFYIGLLLLVLYCSSRGHFLFIVDISIEILLLCILSMCVTVCTVQYNSKALQSTVGMSDLSTLHCSNEYCCQCCGVCLYIFFGTNDIMNPPNKKELHFNLFQYINEHHIYSQLYYHFISCTNRICHDHTFLFTKTELFMVISYTIYMYTSYMIMIHE